MRGGDWTEKEIRRFLKRKEVFENEGLGENDAERLAEQMLYRDRPDEYDNRRVCFECAHFRGGRCKNGQVAVPFQLQRCDGFALKQP